MKLFTTTYYVNRVAYGSHVFAEDVSHAIELCHLRGLGETFVSVGTETGKKSVDSERLSEMFMNDRNHLHILHGVCWLENICKNVDTLADDGLLHSLVHHYADRNEPTNLTKQELYDKIVALEMVTPGLLND